MQQCVKLSVIRFLFCFYGGHLVFFNDQDRILIRAVETRISKTYLDKDKRQLLNNFLDTDKDNEYFNYLE